MAFKMHWNIWIWKGREQYLNESLRVKAESLILECAEICMNAEYTCDYTPQKRMTDLFTFIDDHCPL